MSTAIHTAIVRDPMAWVGSDLAAAPEELVYRLSPSTLTGLEEIFERVRAMPRDEIERHHAGHPDVDGPAREVYDELISGRGLVVVRGFPVEEHTVDEIEIMYWAWLSHFGRLVSNNSFGHRMVRVQQEVLPGGVQPARGTKSRSGTGDAQRRRRHSSRCCGSIKPSRVGRANIRVASPRTTRSWPRAPTSCPSSTAGFPAPSSERAT